MKHYFRQVIFCSEVVGRSFLREILVTDAVGQILDNEKLPPFYQMPLEKLREQDEMILQLPMNFEVRGDHSCPFCGNQTSFYCRCGYISCITPQPKRHVCPQCRDIFTKFGTCATMLSPSGFVHGGQSISHRRNDPAIEGEYKIGDNYKKVSAFLDKLLPDTSSPKKNKALPSSKTKWLPWKKD
jgi:hypothetical protein